MKKFYCYKCKTELAKENRSVEHIITNAIGGKLKSDKLLCIKCNPQLGHSFDAELNRCLLPLAAQLNVKREKGQHPDIKNVRAKSGKVYHLKNGIQPYEVKPEIIIDGNELSVSARDEKQMNSIIDSLKAKYPSLDVKAIKASLIKRKYYLQEALTIEIEVGTPDFMKAILKMAINFYVHSGGHVEEVRHCVNMLESENRLEKNIVSHYYTKDPFITRSQEEVSHNLLVQSNPEKKSLFAYIELFSTYSFIVNLSSEYQGPLIKATYSFDVLTQKVLERDFSINNYHGIFEDSISLIHQKNIQLLLVKLNRFFFIADGLQVKGIISKITKAAMDKVTEKNNNQAFNEKMLEEFSREVSQTIAPFILHLENKKHGNRLRD